MTEIRILGYFEGFPQGVLRAACYIDPDKIENLTLRDDQHIVISRRCDLVTAQPPPRPIMEVEGLNPIDRLGVAYYPISYGEREQYEETSLGMAVFLYAGIIAVCDVPFVQTRFTSKNGRGYETTKIESMPLRKALEHPDLAKIVLETLKT